jgi:hypothetical protein
MEYDADLECFLVSDDDELILDGAFPIDIGRGAELLVYLRSRQKLMRERMGRIGDEQPEEGTLEFRLWAADRQHLPVIEAMIDVVNPVVGQLGVDGFVQMPPDAGEQS